ncbi:SPOSA6832_03768 [Sporobolomyces salmonicolor]|uniref:SPOSA6832_03768-mRNA-1:cds n=1 Tax=Sporidiobolus salmonicolor TaxID=5005 RepID=A0A0D6EQ75_SPOSA|nr:SPOSA6832_03768 [Sporobolomyces salmonicolor]
MSAIAHALTSEDTAAHQLALQGVEGSRLTVPGADGEDGGALNGARNLRTRTITPPPRKDSITPSTSRTASREMSSTSLSVSSIVSGVTSNSSHLHAPNPSPYPASTTSCSSDPEATAAMIHKLYARLEAQGVPGDGWAEGQERTRDGIINREVMQGGDTVRSPKKGKNVAIPMNEDEEAKADHVLRRVDRYGFFSQSHPAALACQHNRLATLSASPFDVVPSMSGSSSRKPPPPKASSPPLRSLDRHHPNRQSTASLLPWHAISPEQAALETKRTDKWASMLTVDHRDRGGNAQDWTVSPDSWWTGRIPGGGGDRGKYRRFQRRVFKGVPDRWRRAVWGLLMERMAHEADGRGTPSLEQLKREYEALLDQPSTQDVQIDLDVPRTISGHVLFHTRYGQGQRALFHVLHAFGVRSEGIGGYCQGMGPIAATLLCYFEPERAYAGLCRLFDQYQLQHIFAPGFPGLVEAFYVQERLVELLVPDSFRHPDAAIDQNEHFISTSAYATKWYITLFANSVPFATQLRLWDGLLLEGLDFLVITALAIIWHFQHEFTAPSASFESILSSLSSYFFVESDDAFLRWIRKTLRLKGLRDKIAAWRTEWRGFVADGSSAGRVT